MTGDRHAKDQLNIRVPADFLARLKADAKRHGTTQADIVVVGATAELDRRSGIATPADGYTPPAPAVFVAAEDEQPQQAGNNCKHRNMKMAKGICPDCHQPVGYK